MELNEATLRFIAGHRQEDVRALALQARRYPSVDVPAALQQIAGWQTARAKLPTWAACPGIVYPPRLAMEQCSSEWAARYKAEIVSQKLEVSSQKSEVGSNLLTSKFYLLTSNSFCDLTGGFGVDCALLAPLFAEVTYVERQEELCEVAKHNFPLLGLPDVKVCCDDALHHLQTMQPVDWIFIDPARRDNHGGKAVAIADCEPDVSVLEELLLKKAKHVLVKLSPMLDLTQAMHDLKHVSEAHVVAVDGECKELLLVLSADSPTNTPEGEAIISSPFGGVEGAVVVAVFGGNKGGFAFSFTRREERESPCTYATELKQYLYEPNAALLKAGAFRTVSHIYKVEKLHPNSHLYTSDRLLADFPGRKFQVVGSCGFGRRELKALMGDERRANLTVRNFPATVAELRHRLKLSEGGTTYLFATTLADERKLLIRCLSV